jgi:hypothetical protein
MRFRHHGVRVVRRYLAGRRAPAFISALLVAIFAVVALVGSAPAGSSPVREVGSHVARGGGRELAKPSAREARAFAARRKRWFGRAGARAASSLAFHSLSAGGSERLLERDYSGALARAATNPASSMALGGHVVRYLNDHSAVVRGAHGLEVKTSTAPLRAPDGRLGKRAVDLRLKRHGASYRPAVPVTQISIGRQSKNGVDVGDEGLQLRLVGADVLGQPMGSRGVFFHGVQADTDAAVLPTLAGAEMFALLRSADSPTELRYEVSLPAGASLQAAADGGAAVTQAGKLTAQILPPSARDAEGTEVPVTMRVLGDTLLLSVDRQHRSVAYPILVDPEVNVTESASGWAFTQNGV